MGCGDCSPLPLIYNAGCTLTSLESTKAKAEQKLKLGAGVRWTAGFSILAHKHSAKSATLSQFFCDTEMCYLYMTLKCALKMPEGRDYGRPRVPVTDVFVSCEYMMYLTAKLPF